MKIDTSTLSSLKANSDVLPGNVYPAKGGRKPGTDYWLVVAVSEHGAHLIGFNDKGEPVSTASYNKSAMRERPVIGRANLSKLTIEVEK